MRKRILSTIAAAAAAVLMLSGFDSAMTVQELQEKSKSALAEMTSLSAHMTGTAMANLSMTQGGDSGATMDIPINGMCSLTCRFNLEPFQMEVTADYRGEAMGQGTEGGVGVYLVTNEDGTGNAYVGTKNESGEIQWEANAVDAESVAQMQDLVRSSLSGDASKLSSLSPNGQQVDPEAMTALVEKYQQEILNFSQIAPQSVTEDNKECYEVIAEIPGDVLYQLVSDTMAASGQTMDETTLQMAQAIMSGLKVMVSSKIDTQTYLPVSATMDLGESDFSMIGDLLVASAMPTDGDATAKVDVQSLKMEAYFTCNEPVTVTVPQEALDAAGGDDIGGGLDIGGGDPTDVIGGLLTGGDGTDTSETTGSDGGDDAAVLNADGSYRIEYEDYLGNVRKADIAVPDGLALSYNSKDYIVFSTDDYSYEVSYSLFAMDTPQATVESDIDTTYMEGNSDYSNVTRTEVKQTTLPDGTVVYYGFQGYDYDSYRFGATSCAVQAGDAIVNFEIQKQDENRRAIEATEEEVQTYAALIKPAA